MKRLTIILAIASALFAGTLIVGCDDDDDSSSSNNVTNNVTNNNDGTNDGTEANNNDGTNDGTETNNNDGTNDGTETNNNDGTNDGTNTAAGNVGDACEAASDCVALMGGDLSSDATCLTEQTIGTNTLTFEGGYCSATCDPNAESDQCEPFGGKCVTNPMTGDSGCLKPCESADECREGYECKTMLPTDTQKYCLPPLSSK